MTLGILRRVQAILRISNPTMKRLPLEMGGTVRPKGNLRSACHIYIMTLSAGQCGIGTGASC